MTAVGPARRAARLRIAFALAGGVLALAAAARARAPEPPLPPAPARWVTDEAGVLSPAAARGLDAELERFEKEQGTQILVAIFRRLPADEVLEEWTQRVAESWGIGRDATDDGAALFVFVEDRALRIEVGYGLEGALTDLESKVILEEVLVPRLRAGDWDGGVTAAARAMIESVRGEYRPSARADAPRGRPSGSLGFFLFVLILFLLISALGSRRRGRSGRYRGGWGGPGPFGGMGGGGFGGGGFGGGGFSGGGGSFGGGGASGRW